jgi:hypothetical protein
MGMVKKAKVLRGPQNEGNVVKQVSSKSVKDSTMTNL